MDLHERIAAALGWTANEARSFSLQALRDLVRPVDAKLVSEIDTTIRSGSVIVGERRR